MQTNCYSDNMEVGLKTELIRPKGFGARHVQTFFLFLAMFLLYSMRVNMSLAIVAMTDQTQENHFAWSHSVQSMILSSFFWGYIILQIPAGELAKHFGGKILIIVSVSVNSLVSLILPIGAKYGDWHFVCACRIMQGLSQAFLYPCTHHLIAQWFPLEEKGRLANVVFAGGKLGMAFQLITSGFVASSWGWQGIFYINGTLGIIWVIGYLTLGSASPEQSKTISPVELKYIQTSLGRVGELKRYCGLFYINGALGIMWVYHPHYLTLWSACPEQSKTISPAELKYKQTSLRRVGELKKYPTPWLSIVTSSPFIAAVVAHCGQNWGFFTLMTEMPTYMAKALGVNIKKNGVLSSLPYLSLFLLSFPLGAMTDLIIRRKWLSLSNTRKLFNSIGLWGPAIALIGLSYTPAGNMLVAVIMLIISVGINAGQYTGFLVIFIDMAPNFSASLMGMSNFVANIISIIAPLVCGWIIQDESDAVEWRKVFFLASGIYFITNLFFLLFSSAERQPWNEPKDTQKNESKNENEYAAKI